VIMMKKSGKGEKCLLFQKGKETKRRKDSEKIKMEKSEKKKGRLVGGKLMTMFLK